MERTGRWLCRETEFSFGDERMTEMKICRFCGTAFLGKSHMNCCQSSDCLETRHILNWRAWSRAWNPIPAEHKIAKCSNCGLSFTQGSKLQLRCSDCIIQFKRYQAETYYAICSIRKDFAMIAQVNPEKAKLIQSDMAKEDGPEFTDLALDGVLKKVIGE